MIFRKPAEATHERARVDIWWLPDEPERSWTVDRTIGRARDELKAHSVPGSETYYSDTKYQLLGKIIEAVTGKSLDVAYQDFFFHPLDLNHTWLVGHR